MAETVSSSPLAAALGDLAAWLKAHGVPGVVVGGVAASFLGRPRLTLDVDVLVLLDEEHWGEFIAAGASYGFAPRRADVVAFARETRVLLLRHEPSGMDADIIVGFLPFEQEVVTRAAWVDLGSFTIPLPRPEDLLIMKAVSRRPRDVLDMESILEAILSRRRKQKK
jgi:hypothetical protein